MKMTKYIAILFLASFCVKNLMADATFEGFQGQIGLGTKGMASKVNSSNNGFKVRAQGTGNLLFSLGGLWLKRMNQDTPWLLGLHGGITHGHDKVEVNVTSINKYAVKSGPLSGEIDGRVGYQLNSSLLFAKVGYHMVKVKYYKNEVKIDNLKDSKSNLSSLLFGVGVMIRLNDHLTTSLELTGTPSKKTLEGGDAAFGNLEVKSRFFGILLKLGYQF